MNLIIPGLARTGTRSLWKFFKEHPEVSVSKIKEPLRIRHNLDGYFSNFDIKNDTKFIFDGTPELTNYEIIHDLKQHPNIDKIYQIWFTRCPLTRLKSVIKRFNKLSDEDLLTLPPYTLNINSKSQLLKARIILGEQNILATQIYPGVEELIESWLKIKNTGRKLIWDKH